MAGLAADGAGAGAMAFEGGGAGAAAAGLRIPEGGEGGLGEPGPLTGRILV